MADGEKYKCAQVNVPAKFVFSERSHGLLDSEIFCSYVQVVTRRASIFVCTDVRVSVSLGEEASGPLDS